MFFPLIGEAKVFNLMAPLVIDSPNEWEQFRLDLKAAKQAGVDAISTDVWWGAVEPQDQQFDFAYYDALSDEIIRSGLKWMPILSTHQCGGNVGDDCNVPLPAWIWTKYSSDPNALRYKSAQGNFSPEVLSAWSTEFTRNEYRDLYLAFLNHFSDKLPYMTEINISLGPAGELRYPSYNSHDRESGYPGPGVLQSFSDLAVQSFQNYVKAKYKDLDSLKQAWGFNLNQWQEVYPPTNSFDLFGSYGRDFFDWYHSSLMRHGDILMSTAKEVFGNRVPVGAKVPGVHWMMASGRLAELSAGLLDVQNQDIFQLSLDRLSPLALGYESVVYTFAKNKVVLHFTCLEKNNYEDQANNANSLAETLVFLVSKEAKRQNVKIMGENALAENLNSEKAWQNMENVLNHSSYEGLTLLRINQMSPYSWNRLQSLIQRQK